MYKKNRCLENTKGKQLLQWYFFVKATMLYGYIFVNQAVWDNF